MCALIVLDTNVVAVSLPSIARSFQASFADVEWVVSAYMVAFASCLLPAGALADRFGRKRMLLLGLAVFFLASLGCGLAPSVTVLNVSRALKGVGAALLLTAALAVIANTFHAGPARVRAWAVWGTCMGLATTVAPLIGGMITQWFGWRWIFLFNLPVCTVLALCALRAIRESRNPDAGPVDIAGSALFGAALALAIWALIEAPTAGWASLATAARCGASVLLFVGFVWVQRVRQHAMVDLTLFTQPRFVAAVLAMFGYAACAQVMMTFLPLYLQNAFGLSAIAAGMGMLPFALAMVVGPHLGAALAKRQSALSLLSTGLLMIGVGNLVTALCAAPFAGDAHYAFVAVGMVITGLGAGVLNGDTQKAIMACVPAHRTGMASGISTTTRFTGIVSAVGVLGAVLAARTHSVFDARPEVTPALRSGLDAGFMSRVLSGDIAGATAHLSPAAGAALRSAAHFSFASGFAAALYLAGLAAIAMAIGVRVLAGRATPAHVSGVVVE
nr:MFS transporter [Paraburkholderia sp. DHOC27]